MFRLRIDGGPRNGENLTLTPGKTLQLGRGRECDIRFPEDATMSRVQAEMTWDGTSWTLVNKSQHGTLVGGQRVDTTKVLSPGDQLVLGGTRVIYESDDPAGEKTLAPPAAQVAAAIAAGAPAAAGNTPSPMPRDAAKDAAAAAKKPAAPAAKAPAKAGGKGSPMVPVLFAVMLLFCCVASGIFYKFVYPNIHH
jgi:pSer/pThr/pTyr-binding forkhead associated (FHA) protein